jgi:beta-mannosidase
LPSSPYIDEIVYQLGLPAEDHRWGPRDYFKGEFYASTNCHFASEIGYHGCPSPKSIEQFIPAENLPKNRIDEMNTDPAWLVHAAGMETCVENNPYAYRLPLMISQVDRIFTSVGQDLDTFARQSQISQGEAMKFFIELFRTVKWRKTGILWWNITDGWPQISDAVVDWYGCKKIAYSYIKRSQTPLCIMCKEPNAEGMLTLTASNDTQEEKHVSYSVENVATGEILTTGEFTISANGICEIGQIPEKEGGFYLIKWTDGKQENCNHFTCKIGDKWDYEKYAECMKKAGFYNEFEGF